MHTDTDAQRVQARVRQRVLRRFARQGYLDKDNAKDMEEWRNGGGFSVDASVRIKADDRAGLERFLRYCAHPPFALERLEAIDSSGMCADYTEKYIVLKRGNRLFCSKKGNSNAVQNHPVQRIAPPNRVLPAFHPHQSSDVGSGQPVVSCPGDHIIEIPVKGL